MWRAAPPAKRCAIQAAPGWRRSRWDEAVTAGAWGAWLCQWSAVAAMAAVVDANAALGAIDVIVAAGVAVVVGGVIVVFVIVVVDVVVAATVAVRAHATA